MNQQEYQDLIDSYLDWLRQGLSVEAVGKACELTTPFLDRQNDHPQVYAVQRNGTIVLSPALWSQRDEYVQALAD